MKKDLKALCFDERIVSSAKSIPVNVILDDIRLGEYATRKSINADDMFQLLTYITVSLPDFRLITLSKGCDITFGELLRCYDSVLTHSIVLHRVNYLLRSCMMVVYELLEKEHRLRFLAKKYYLQAERAWEQYNEPRRKKADPSAWFTLQDHFVFMEGMVSASMETVYETLRDFMIRLGWRDIELKARIELVFLLYKVVVHTFNHFFEEYVRTCGVDFSRLFSSSDMRLMVKYFAMMSESLGVRLSTDKYGLYEIEGVSIGKNLRVTKAWNDFIEKLEDEDLMDESARKAIELNPKIAEDYRMSIEDDDRKRMESQLTKLGEKFKVTRNKK